MSQDRDARWRAVATMRPMLVRIGLAQGVSLEDAEDAAQEALVRAVTSDNLDMTRAEAWLTRVTQRLCIDRHRQRTRDERLQLRIAPVDALCPSPEDAVCDQALGEWALRHADLLAPRERDVLFARADGHDAAAAAHLLGLTYKSAESAYTRARAKMRAAVRAALGALGLLRVSRPRRAATIVVAAAPAVVLLALQAPLGLLAPWERTAPVETRKPPVSLTTPARSDQVAVSLEAGREAQSPTAKPAAVTPPPPRDVVDTPPVRVGPVHHDGAKAGWQNEDETLEETLDRCLEKGIEITPQRIGCRE